MHQADTRHESVAALFLWPKLHKQIKTLWFSIFSLWSSHSLSPKSTRMERDLATLWHFDPSASRPGNKLWWPPPRPPSTLLRTTACRPLVGTRWKSASTTTWARGHSVTWPSFIPQKRVSKQLPWNSAPLCCFYECPMRETEIELAS